MYPAGPCPKYERGLEIDSRAQGDEARRYRFARWRGRGEMVDKVHGIGTMNPHQLQALYDFEIADRPGYE